MRHLATFVAAVSLIGWAAAAPLVLIVQRPVPLNKDGDPNVVVASHLSAALDAEGRVATMVWSMADPSFRTATHDGTIAKYVEKPTDAEAQALAQQLKANYVFILVAERRDGRVYPRGELFRTGASKPVFRIGSEPGKPKPKRMGLTDFVSDPRDHSMDGAKVDADKPKPARDESSLVIFVNGLPDWDQTALSIARTWASQLGQGPFKNYPPHPKLDVKDPNNAAVFSGAPADPGTGRKAGDATIAKAEALLKKGDVTAAILCLRDLVNMAPLDAEPRGMLARALVAAKLPQQAALEAGRAAELAPAKPEYWLLAARAWLLAGKVDDARRELNEALARGADDPATNELQGDLSLMDGHNEDALKAYAKALAGGNRFESRIGRCVALALLGRPDECDAELKQLPGGAEPAAQKLAYERAIALVDPMVPAIAEDLRKLIPQIRVRSKDPLLAESADSLLKRSLAISRLVGGLPVPHRYTKSHEDRDLAHKLLAQAAQEVLAFAKSADEDVAAEAAISLGEAFKLFPVIREQFDVDTRLGKDSG